jgi:uncharacterized protein (DUF2141 family)
MVLNDGKIATERYGIVTENYGMMKEIENSLIF